MREIKFRAWDSEGNEHSSKNETPNKMYTSECFEKTFGLQCFPSKHYLKNSRFTFEEYINRKDMDGVEVYEGDIVGVKIKKGTYYTAVIHDGFGFVLLSNLTKIVDSRAIISITKVIGNIHEVTEKGNPSITQALVDVWVDNNKLIEE